MDAFDRITFDTARMGGKPCIRHQRITVGAIVGLVAAGHSIEEILDLYPYLKNVVHFYPALPKRALFFLFLLFLGFFLARGDFAELLPVGGV